MNPILAHYQLLVIFQWNLKSISCANICHTQNHCWLYNEWWWFDLL